MFIIQKLSNFERFAFLFDLLKYDVFLKAFFRMIKLIHILKLVWSRKKMILWRLGFFWPKDSFQIAPCDIYSFMYEIICNNDSVNINLYGTTKSMLYQAILISFRQNVCDILSNV